LIALSHALTLPFTLVTFAQLKLCMTMDSQDEADPASGSHWARRLQRVSTTSVHCWEGLSEEQALSATIVISVASGMGE
jgi:predicted protein tyrosine phosphatase